MNSSCKNLDVFDFKEDELSECPSSKLFSKFKNPNAIDKYSFLEEVADGTNFQSKEIDNLPCVDVDAMDNVHSCDNAVSHIPIGLEGEDPAPNKMSGLDDFLLFNSTNHEQQAQFIPDKLKPGSFSAQLEPRASNPGEVSLGISQLKFSLQESPSSDESVDVISDADESICESSPSTSDVSGDDYPLDGPLSDDFLGGWEMGDRNAVVVCPDYIVYCGRFCTESVLIFSSNCIEVKGSTTYRNDRTFNFQWGIDDIVDIESQWSQSLQIAKVKLCLMSKDAMQADDAQGTSGIEELKFAVHDSNWYEKREQITSLDVRYKALWKVEFDSCIGGDGVALPGQNGIHIPKKRYFPK
ncbi:probable ubiquitin-like-specific protease 2A isoform X3 [Camellia sinensis]|uniref:probable ubiquitin-like-specific protease 2A isoform X3 n=1 Tax=Camellia sinensis TaxID=4442 RepID=UPI0010360485|nr:probable ubiquitin-like-specific protease 2A isoform X3 [Camellia sinensis]